MIRYWITATLMGAALGLLLYGCVRLRMHVGPILRDRYGNWVRQTYWVFTIIFMVVLANLGLSFLRNYIPGTTEPNISLILEIWFALLAMGIAMVLVIKQLRKDSCEKPQE